MSRARIVPGDGDQRHGTDGGYCNNGCRCDACRTAHAAASRGTITRRANSRARGLAETWLRENHREVWEQLLDQSYEHLGGSRRPHKRNKFSPPTSPVGGEAPGVCDKATPLSNPHITARDGDARGTIDPDTSPDPAPAGSVSPPAGATSPSGAL